MRRKTFTLIEVIISIVLITIILGIAFSALTAVKDSLLAINSQVTLSQDLRRALRTMTEELSESAATQVKDENEQSLNLVQKSAGGDVLECLPQDQECVYSVIKFKKPQTWSSGEISQWSDYITYSLTSQGITRQVGLEDPEELVSNITLVEKSASASYSNDPNSSGSGIENIGANKLKISLLAQREGYFSRQIEVEIGGIVYLRN